MEDKLQLKHLACYLPYGLKISAKTRYDREERIGRMTELTFESNHGDWVKVFFDDVYTFINTNTYEESSSNAHYFFFEQDVIKPLLIPMSELPKQAPSTVVGIRRIDEINSKSTYYIKEFRGETFFDDLPEHMPVEDVWDTYENLFEHHFDVFGLIEKGLALSKLEHGR